MSQSNTQTAGYQSWQKLAFLHWRVPASMLQPLIPSELTIEEFDGSAWLGLVPFSMERIRPWWFPAVPGISWFLETNIRTYVVDRNGVRGVWFFSLDANKQLAVTVARTFWHLPYRMAELSMTVSKSPDGLTTFHYRGTRIDQPPAEYDAVMSVDLQASATPAAPDTLEHFLVERYILFAQKRNGKLMTGQVHHAPYLIRPIVSCRVSQSLSSAEGCPTLITPPDHAAYSEGVDVRVSPLK
jgi:uncharacterized protein YqjF (DUF2071 family)